MHLITERKRASEHFKFNDHVRFKGQRLRQINNNKTLGFNCYTVLLIPLVSRLVNVETSPSKEISSCLWLIVYKVAYITHTAHGLDLSLYISMSARSKFSSVVRLYKHRSFPKSFS